MAAIEREIERLAAPDLALEADRPRAVDRRHLDLIELKVKDLAVLKKAVGADCLRDHADTLLKDPAQADLGHTAVMLLRDVRENVAVEIGAARERRVCLDDNPVLLAEMTELILAEERMILDLVDSRDNARVHQQPPSHVRDKQK